jgi:hypothetical protein
MANIIINYEIQDKLEYFQIIQMIQPNTSKYTHQNVFTMGIQVE